jgi:hypothetical protein
MILTHRPAAMGFAAAILLMVMSGIVGVAEAPKSAPPSDAPEAHAPNMASFGLPEYHVPPAFSVDLVVQSPEANLVMKRFVDQGHVRTEMAMQGQDMVTIETGDEKGTMYTVMPKEKRAIKQSRESIAAMAGDAAAPEARATGAGAGPPADMKIEDLGDETRDGRAVKKLRLTVPEGAALAWFDKATGAPVRMESNVEGKPTSIEWKNLVVAPQPAKLFEVPKGYEVTDMDEMMAKMKSMGGMGGALKGAMGGMAQGFGQNMGASFGSGLGGSLGGALGGPLGAVAGQYLGGKIGGAIGKKAAGAVTPGH